MICFIIILGWGVYGYIDKIRLVKSWLMLKLGDGYVKGLVYYFDYFVYVKNVL